MKGHVKEEDESELADWVKDPRLTPAENAFLVERLSEMGEAFIELLLKRRQGSRNRDVVAG
jgi:hypothetical protein